MHSLYSRWLRAQREDNSQLENDSQAEGGLMHWASRKADQLDSASQPQVRKSYVGPAQPSRLQPTAQAGLPAGTDSLASFLSRQESWSQSALPGDAVRYGWMSQTCFADGVAKPVTANILAPLASKRQG